MNNNNKEIYVRLGDVEGLSNIFSDIGYDFTEIDETFTNQQLNAMYSKHSKNRIISPAVQDNLASASFTGSTPDVFGRVKYRWTATISNVEKKALADYINAKFNQEWTRLKGVYLSEYDPIENYNKHEERHPNLTDERTDDLYDQYNPGIIEKQENKNLKDKTTYIDYKETRTPNTTQTRTDQNLTEKFTPRQEDKEVIKAKNKQTTNNSLYGFNSNDAVPSSKSDVSGQNTDNEQEKKTTHTGYDEKVLSGSQTIAETGKETLEKEGSFEVVKSGCTEMSKIGFDKTDHKGTQTTTHQGEDVIDTTGNIGVTTSQQMLESEIALWKWNFLESIFNNLDSVLTLAIY